MTTATRKQKDARNADRRYQRAENKMSKRIRNLAAEFMALDPTMDLGQAMKRAIMTVAAEAK